MQGKMKAFAKALQKQTSIQWKYLPSVIYYYIFRLISWRGIFCAEGICAECCAEQACKDSHLPLKVNLRLKKKKHSLKLLHCPLSTNHPTVTSTIPRTVLQAECLKSACGTNNLTAKKETALG